MKALVMAGEIEAQKSVVVAAEAAEAAETEEAGESQVPEADEEHDFGMKLKRDPKGRLSTAQLQEMKLHNCEFGPVLRTSS